MAVSSSMRLSSSKFPRLFTRRVPNAAVLRRLSFPILPPVPHAENLSSPQGSHLSRTLVFYQIPPFLSTTHQLEFTHFCPLAEVRLLKPGIQRRWLAKDAPLPFRFARPLRGSRFALRQPDAFGAGESRAFATALHETSSR